jgi:hypothetical protein
MDTAVKQLYFAVRWPNIAVWRVVNLFTVDGPFRAEYVSGSEFLDTSGNWNYSFLVQQVDLPSPLTLDDIINTIIISPFVEAYAPCDPVLSNCFAAIPELPDGQTDYEVAVVIGPNDCGKWCVYRTPPEDHDPYWTK